ncbi:MAG TPA: hypothetical protein VJJ81_03130 [Candidatus Babeliales bacterium]|nr:hypothetical protein [Candidatus Babeliales bacterium]
MLTMLNFNFKTILILFLLANSAHLLTCNLDSIPSSDLNLYQVLGCAAYNKLNEFNSNSKPEILKIAFEQASNFAISNPNWGSTIRKTIQTLSHPGKRNLYNQDLQAATISELSENIINDLDNSNADQLIQDLVALNKLPGGNNIIMNLTEDPKGLDYDHLRAKLLMDADRVIEHINKNIFGY